MLEPTIFALASGAGRSAIAVVRLSGPATGTALKLLGGTRLEPRRATLVALRDPDTREPLDRALMLWFPRPHSFTGEDAGELHLHGGRAVVAGVLSALARVDGLRLAEPGEFTRRAFRNGKMDLPAVEGLADLIDAQTQAQRRQALRQLDGALGRWVEGLREGLLGALALAEGAIDFAEEDDLVASFRREISDRVAAVQAIIGAQLEASASGERLREGIVVTLAGPTNAGKSTLLNALAGRDVAIVSAHAGTTRDAIEVELDLGGCPLVLIDTAGLRETDDPVEREGMARARARAASADLVLWLSQEGVGCEAADLPATTGELWRVATKIDLTGEPTDKADYAISARTGAGLGRLLAGLRAFAGQHTAGGETALITRLRHRVALEEARDALARVLASEQADLELVAEDLRSANAALSSLIGAVQVEEVLGSIFARFCIGK